MKINGIDLTEYNAKLVGFQLESSDVTVNTDWAMGAIQPYIDTEVVYRFKELSLKVEFKGDFNTQEEAKSRFLSNIAVCTLTDYRRGLNELKGHLKSHKVDALNPLYQVVEYELNVIEEKPEEIYTTAAVATDTFTMEGTGVTPARLEFTPTAAGDYKVTLNPLTEREQVFILESCTANTTRVIDVNTGVFEGAVNKFDYTKFTYFPRVYPGENRVMVDVATYSLKLIFKPRVV